MEVEEGKEKERGNNAYLVMLGRSKTRAERNMVEEEKEKSDRKRRLLRGWGRWR